MPLANEIYENRFSAIRIRLKKIKEVDLIVNVSVFDFTKNILWNEGENIVNITGDLKLFDNKNKEKFILAKKIKYQGKKSFKIYQTDICN